ncbi:hypothetical protein OQZ33_21480 [Pedobacter sp. MC2016-05]|uniref:hypothetical protein n=1 Tax=Pedobacter sp. MC2016-05 TaxID=2994474 RepID=UPI0022471A41|nr:hypothetical protein [Pedobacter sp. MC2016-05]MCX2476920.1 hypothetical protein [Pedobacter sp. MC2016-05]
MREDSIFLKYDLLLPSKFDGGYLILSLYEKIKNEEIEQYFTNKEITEILQQIAHSYGEGSVRQWSKIKGSLFHYYIRNHPDEPWKYYLTDYAKNVVELMLNKLNNPYREHSLRKSFEESFNITHGEIKNVLELDRKFGRIFIQGPKSVVSDHLESLEEELKAAYEQLNEILRNEELNDAANMVRNFTKIFSKFGDRALDITNAILSKDKFLRDLQFIVDDFYGAAVDQSISEETEKLKTRADWERAREIYLDITTFFNTIDQKIDLIRRQIRNASSKLTELQEQFSARAHLRMLLKKFFHLALDCAHFADDKIGLKGNFPLKKLVHEKTMILYPKYYEFGLKYQNILLRQEDDNDYHKAERERIEKEIRRQQVIYDWSEKIKRDIKRGTTIEISELMETVSLAEGDISLAYQVAANIISFASADIQIEVKVSQKLITLSNQHFSLWKTRISKA